MVFVVLCCAVLCCVVLCCAVLCCAVLCCVVLCCVVLCCVVLCSTLPSPCPFQVSPGAEEGAQSRVLKEGDWNGREDWV